jgi:hypothetical protein
MHAFKDSMWREIWKFWQNFWHLNGDRRNVQLWDGLRAYDKLRNIRGCIFVLGNGNSDRCCVRYLYFLSHDATASSVPYLSRIRMFIPIILICYLVVLTRFPLRIRHIEPFLFVFVQELFLFFILQTQVRICHAFSIIDSAIGKSCLGLEQRSLPWSCWSWSLS